MKKRMTVLSALAAAFWGGLLQAEPGISLETATVTTPATAPYNGIGAQLTGVTVVLGGTALTEGVDYAITYDNNVWIGTATAYINGIGDYTGQVVREFAVVPNAGVAVSQQSVVRPLDLRQPGSRKIDTLDQVFPFAMNSSADWAKDGVPAESSRARICEMTGTRPDDPTTWVEAGGVTDLNAVFGETTDDSWRPVRQGLYRAELLIGGTVVGAGYFDMSETAGLAGKPSVETATVTTPATAPYNGIGAQLTGVTVVLGGTPLTEGVDYVITYENNVWLGTATAYINGIGDYTGQVVREFAVVPNAGVAVSQQVVVRPLDLRSSGSRKIDTLDQVFPFAMNSSPVWAKGGVAGESSFARIREMTGTSPDDPMTWVEAGGVTNLDAVVGETTDDSWTPVRQGLYRAEILIGDTVVEAGYFDMTETEGLAGKPSVETATVTMPTTAPYNGTGAQLKGVTVVLDGKTLVEGVDYQITYENNLWLGTATVYINGAGDYAGQIARTFEVVPATGEDVAAEAKGANLDLRTNEVFVCSLSRDPVFTWNTSENFTTNPPAASVWRIGGLPEEANAVATISLDPMASRTAEPDATHRIMFCAQSGEGAKRVRDVAPGYYLARLTVTLDGEPVPGELTRIVRMTGGLVIFLK